MVSDEILSSYTSSEVTVKFTDNSHKLGRLEKVNGESVLLRLDDGKTEVIPIAHIKYIERKPPGHDEFENAARTSIERLVKSGKAKTEKDAVELLKKTFKPKR